MDKVTIRFNFNIDLNKLPVADRLKLRIHSIVQEIKRKSASGDCIFRGETRHYDCNQVSSTLYRKCKGILTEKSNDIDMELIQSRLLYNSMGHHMEDPTKEESHPKLYEGSYPHMNQHFIEENLEVLTKIQHWGGSTNLIDFTEDYGIAFFFACNGDYDKDGRIIIKSRSSLQGLIRKPKEPNHRVEAQKSVFISPPMGFIELDKSSVVNIPKNLKTVILKLCALQNPQIIEERIYGDLHGFIKLEDRYLQADIHFLRSIDFERKAERAQTEEEKHFFLEEAIKLYQESIKKFPHFQRQYFRCARLYGMLGKIEEGRYYANEAAEWSPYSYPVFRTFFSRRTGITGFCSLVQALQLHKFCAIS